MKIECQNINKSYIEAKSFNKNNVLKEINLQIPAGETIALTGPSGSGKTTLLNIISGLDEPTSGNVIFDSKSMQKFDLNQRTKFRNHNLGVVFQFFNLLDDFSVYENIAMPLLIRGEKNN